MVFTPPGGCRWAWGAGTAAKGQKGGLVENEIRLTNC